MLVPILMAIWFAYNASRAGRNWAGWGVLGFGLAFIVGALASAVISFLSGPVSSVEGAIGVAFATVAITLVVGKLVISSVRKEATTRASLKVQQLYAAMPEDEFAGLRRDWLLPEAQEAYDREVERRRGVAGHGGLA